MNLPQDKGRWLDAHWRTGVLFAWLAIAAAMLVFKAQDIAALALPDTDDNLRLAQVRAWMAGQPWGDLVQHRLAPPEGANIHWSRLVDLPIAGLILLLRPLLGAAAAEQWACGIAPLLPLGLACFSIAAIARRLIDPSAWPLAILLMLCANFTLGMWAPLRIDHHGWQLALLVTAIAGLTDPRRRRGGILAGIASAASLAIGLEMLLFLAAIGGLAALAWIADRDEAGRLRGYGAALAGGCAIGFLLFASQANRQPVCDALSPVWLSAFLPAGAALMALAMLPLAGWRARLAAAALAGGAIAIGFALLWPDCLARPEGVSDQLRALWLDNVREARPVQAQDWRTAIRALALPLIGLAGTLAMLRRSGAGRGGEDMRRWTGIALLGLGATALLFWQMRIAPAAQLIAVPGAAALAWRMMPFLQRSKLMPVRIAAMLGGFLLVSGLFTLFVGAAFPPERSPAAREGRANAARCKTAEALAPIAALPRATILAPIDLSPRLLVATHHDAIAGPYHRNGPAILDVMLAFREGEGRARETIDRYDVGYVLLCPGLGEERIYRGGGEASFFQALGKGRPPGWLEPVPLPEGSPFRLWRVVSPRG